MMQKSWRAALASLLSLCLASVLATTTVASIMSQEEELIRLPDEHGRWMLPPDQFAGRPLMATGTVEIRGAGTFAYDLSEVQSLRPDFYREGRFSVFDVLVHLAERGDIELDYRYSEDMATHVIERLNGLEGWWYDAHYAGGLYERTVVRMDHFPVLDGMRIRFYLEQPDRLDGLYASFRDEALRRETAGGAVVIPKVVVRGPRTTTVFQDVVVQAHNTRGDMFEQGVVTALDVLLSLGNQGHLSRLALHMLEETGSLCLREIIVDDAPPLPMQDCVYVHEVVGSHMLEPFLGTHVHGETHVHLTGDLEPLVSPALVRWDWACP